MGSHDTLKVMFFWLTFPTTAVNLVKNDWHVIPTGFLHKFGLVWPLGGGGLLYGTDSDARRIFWI